MSAWQLITAGFLLHVAWMIAVFDIYFMTTILPLSTKHNSPIPPPAKRVVYIVADGLRADKMLMLQPDGSTPAPFIRSVCEEKGSWGVSWTGMPSATRPGHVAMTAGFFEDPTSVAKDISGGAIDFDTVFAETRYTWTWDTPKFLNKVADYHPERIFSEQFPSEQKYLAGIDPKDMDSWVFDEVKKFMDQAKTDEDLRKKLDQDKLLFFLHLGGIDHAGYIVRPQSPEYLQHVAFLDRGIRHTVEMFEELFNHDGKTAYLYTSDHGMNDWGAHGDGSPDEVQCPLLVWGAGIQKAAPETRLDMFKDTISQDWGLDKWYRRDIDQRKMAGLLASMIGVPFPQNAVMPVPDEFLDIPDESRAHVLYANLKQLLDNFVAVERDIYHGLLAFKFRAYGKVTTELIPSIKTDIEAFLASKQYQQAISVTREKIQLAVDGLRHYQHYNTQTLRFAVAMSMIGWFIVLVLHLLQAQMHWEDNAALSPLAQNTKNILLQCAAAFAVFQLIFLYSQTTKWTHVLQYMIPLPIWTAVIIKWYEIGDIKPILRQQKEMAGIFAAALITVVMMAYGLYYRGIISICMFGFVAWLFKGKANKLDQDLMVKWTACITVMILLVARPVGTRDLNYELVLFGAVLVVSTASILYWKIPDFTVKARRLKFLSSKFVIFQICVMVLSTFILYYTAYLSNLNIRTPLLNQATSWTIFVVSLVEPVFVNTDVQSRLIAVAFAMVSPYILLSIGWETLYYFFVLWSGYLLIEVERNLTKSQPIFLPRSSSAPPANRVSSKGGAAGAKQGLNGQSFVKHHKHTRSNDILIMEPTVTEWASLNFSPDEGGTEMQSKRVITTGDVRRQLFFFVFGVATLFGTGNVCSIASFDCQDVFCFISLQNPPKMGPLMVFKLIIPGITMGCFLRVVNMVTFTSIKNCSVILMLIINAFVFVNFLWLTDVGGWTLVGESVSHYVVTQCLGAFFCLQFGISYIFTSVKV
ncbi:GPI ethanolamine phosphate transferase 1-like [Mya arenaria]|uniref:GPI ethanolamine phosphate transferase 1-like n=1 Tax=Mya arenaria TaxID=6604 RepID=UPI0022E2876C|nr:GPI ethanolamine phosphate transferase 1-like [Mya arenaria]